MMAMVITRENTLFDAVAAVIAVVCVPECHEQREADDERGKTTHHVHQAFEGVRHLERDDQQRHCKREDRVREAFDARDLFAAPAEVLFAARRQWQTLAQAAVCRTSVLAIIDHPLMF